MKKRQKKLGHYFYLAILWAFSLLFFGLILGTIAHEVVGHAFTAIILGNAEINAVKILIFQIDSSGFSLVPFDGFGMVWWSMFEPLSIHVRVFTLIMASIVPMIVSIVFAFLLLFGKQRGFKKILFVSFAIWFIDPLCNYFIWPYLGGGGSDFEGIVTYTGFNILPFTIIAIASLLIISSIILYKLFNKESKKVKKIFFYLLTALSISLILYVLYLVVLGNVMVNGGIETCQKIEDLNRMQGCVYSLAVATGNSSVCNFISETNKSEECFWSVAYWTENPELCEKMLIQGDRDDCIFNIVEKNQNLTICNLISNETLSDECLSSKE